MPKSLSTFLPPVLLALFFGLVTVRCMGEPYRTAARAQIDGMIEGGSYEEAHRRLESYLARYDAEDDYWYAARAWFAMRRPGRAIDAIWNHPAIPAQADTARRFARTAFYAIGWSDAARKNATALEPLVLVALVEGGDAWATERLRNHALTLELNQAILYLYPAYRRATRPPLEVIVRAFRDRPDRKFDTAAALGAMQAAPYPEKADDVARLRKVVLSTEWRRGVMNVWAVSALALGRSGDPDAMETLRVAAAGFEGATTESGRESLALVRNGLVAGGDWTGAEDQMARILAREAGPLSAIWYLEALIHRYRQGDMRSEAGIVSYWTDVGAEVVEIRARLARAMLLQERPPSQEAQAQWVGRMVADLDRPGSPLLLAVLAGAWRLRDGVEGAREGLIEILRTAGRAFDADPAKVEELMQPYLEALRALYLYG